MVRKSHNLCVLVYMFALDPQVHSMPAVTHTLCSLSNAIVYRVETGHSAGATPPPSLSPSLCLSSDTSSERCAYHLLPACLPACWLAFLMFALGPPMLRSPF